jgi:hypothetical protein
MRADDDTSHLPIDERRRAIAAILAEGVLRLRRRDAIPLPENASQNPLDSCEYCLEAVSENPLTVHVG